MITPIKELKNLLEIAEAELLPEGNVLHGLLVPVELVREIISAQPEPQEGYWIRTDCGLDVECKCSKCGYKDFVEPGDEYWFNRNFCPNCGAKMKGERQK